MGPVLTAIVIMTLLGLFFAVVLAVANHFLAVEEDPRLGVVTDLLPGNNCGACGQPGCGAFAGTLIDGSSQPGGCTVADEGTLARIAKFLGVSVGGGVKNVARLRCAGGDANVLTLAEYRGHGSCRSAVVVDGGGRACTYGCLGLADCERACTFDAIHMGHSGLPVVDFDACTACGDCVDVCPLDLFVIQSAAQRLFVQCASPLTGDDARAACAVACDGCGRCASDSPDDVVEIKRGLPVIRWDLPEQPPEKATWRCPTGAITWLDEQQFADEAKAGATRA